MCTTREEIREIMEQGVSALSAEISLLKAHQDEYQRDLKRHMDEESRWGVEVAASRKDFIDFKNELMRQEVARGTTLREMEDRILEKVKRADKEEKIERDRLMVSMVDTKLSNMKASLLTWMGFGGLVAIASVIFYFGGLGEKVTNNESDIKDMKKYMDLGATSNYVDQQNVAQDVRISRIEDTMKEGFDELKQEIRNIR
jgi:hypothetical protein